MCTKKKYRVIFLMKTKVKKLICILLAVISLCSLTVSAAAAERGDVDFDGSVTVSDARIVLRCAVGLEMLSTEGSKLADFDGDGTVSVADARSILRVAVGLGSALDAALYNQAHRYLRASVDDIKEFDIVYANLLYKSASKWCCYYSVNAVFRPALKNAGYSDEEINRVAPVYFDPDRLQKIEQYNTLFKNYGKTFGLLKNEFKVFVPSILMDYYYNTPEAGTVYTFREFYDDLIENDMYYRSSNASQYSPKVGDFLFMSNKKETYHEGIPTIDHTAQIIEVYSDGSFLCTEGSIIDPKDSNDMVPRVRERRYIYDSAMGTYKYDKNSIVFVLTAVRPNLSH